MPPSNFEAPLTTLPEIPESVDSGLDGEVEVEVDVPFDPMMEMGEPDPLSPLAQHDDNLAEFLDENDLQGVADELMELYEDDVSSRSEWEAIAKDAINMLGFSVDERSEPFEGACGATHPVLSQAVIKFQAKAFKELFPSGGPVRTQIMGVHNPEREQQAKRVKDYMNYQTTHQMPEFGRELDKMLFYVGLFGSAFKKTYYDGALNRPTSRVVRAEDFVIDYWASDLETAERYTHRQILSTNEIKRHMLNGVFRDIELEDPTPPEADGVSETVDELQGRSRNYTQNDQHTVLEMHVMAEIPGDEEINGLLKPYIVSIHEDSGHVLAIRRNWKEDDPSMEKRQYFVHYQMIPGLGFYGYGYLHLIGGLTKTATASMRQLIDAGTLANLPGGFKAHGLRVLAPDDPIQPGEWRDVNAPAGDLAKSLLPLPYKEPSSTLFNLLQFVVETAKEFADSTDRIVDEASNYGPVGTTMALMEHSTKMFSAIHKRLHSAQAIELNLLAQINSEYLPEQYPYEQAGQAQNIFREDFDMRSIDVIPVSDPNMPTAAHRIAKINAIMSIAASDPAAHDMNAIRLDLYLAMGVDQPEKYLAKPPQPISADPITENSSAMVGKQVAAQPHQNHDAHVTVHASVLNNPAYAEMVGMRQILLAHINEHLSHKFRMEILQMAGDPQMQQAVMAGDPLDPQVENQIAIMAADASDALLELDRVKSEILAGNQEDPVIELQRKEIELREMKVQNDALKMALAHEIDKDKLTLDRDKLKLQEAEVMIDDANTDLDREARIQIEENKLAAQKVKNNERPSSS